MAEEGTTGPDTTVAEPPVTTVEPAVPDGQPAPSIVDVDGKFSEGWRNSLPEDIRSEVCLGTVSDVESMAKQFVHAQRMIGKDKISLPNENSTESEWEAFHVAGGRPTTAADYNIVKPKDYPDELFSEELAGKFQELAFKAGLSKKQVDTILEFNLSSTLAAFTDQQNAQELAMKETVEGLHADWGKGYEQRIHFGDIAITQAVGDSEEFRARLTEKFGNDPDFIRFASNLGSKFAESSGAPTTIPTPSDVQDKIAEEMAKDSYSNAQNPAHAAQVQKVKRLFEEKHAVPTG